MCSVVLILASSSLTKLGTRTPMFQATLGSFPTYSQLRTPNSTPVEDCYNYMLLVQHLPFWCFPNLCRLDVTQVIRLLKELTCQFISSRLGQFRFWNHNSGVVNLWGANCSHNTVPFSFSTIFFFLYSTYFNLFAPAILAVWVTSYNDDHELHWTVSAVLLLNELYRTYFKNQYCVEYRWTILYKLF